MKRLKLCAAAALALFLAACGTEAGQPQTAYVDILLADGGIQVNGQPVDTNRTAAVFAANDIVYYQAGQDFTYGEGTAEEAHEPQAAVEHTVVHISQPGTYRLSGSLSKGQIAVDLGEEAKSDPDAVVTLVLNGVDITCDVAPAVIFYNVYECSASDGETASAEVDTSAAGARVIVADGTENTVNGSHVARIYKPGSVVLNAAGTAVEDAKKLHKYDGAFYSKMSMTVDGQQAGTGLLTVNADNEGLGSEMHLTVNGGNICIHSGNDGINTNEDGVSVTTVNGGTLRIRVTGETGEGDGIDSNGWLVINGGTVIAQACADSADAGIDADLGILIRGGTVLATGHMLDPLGEGGQNYAVFSFAEEQAGGQMLCLKAEQGSTVAELWADNRYSTLVYSDPALVPGDYTLWNGETQLAGQRDTGTGRPGMPGGFAPADLPEGAAPPAGGRPFDGQQPPQMPDGQQPPQMPEGQQPPQMPGGQQPPTGFAPGGPGRENGRWEDSGEARSAVFSVTPGGNLFRNIAPAQ